MAFVGHKGKPVWAFVILVMRMIDTECLLKKKNKTSFVLTVDFRNPKIGNDSLKGRFAL